MSDSLLPYYDRELVAIRKLAGEFARANPKRAGQLRIAPDGVVDDPHVERLLQGTAFLAARVQHRLDDELPEITDVLLELLCPHLLAPVPSMMTVQLLAKPEATGPSRIPRGTPLETDPVRGEVLHYQTCHDTTLWPVAVADAKLAGLPLTAPLNPQAPRAVSVLRLVLTTTVPDLTFADLGVDRLRFFLRGSFQVSQLLELLCTSTLSIALASGPTDPQPTLLPKECLSHAGFARDEAALPSPQHAFSGFRLLTEYFAFPEKFLYLDLSGIEARSYVQKSDRLEVFFYLSRSVSELERAVSAENFVLGCTPAVNLFRYSAEPIQLDGTQSDWLVVPDSRKPAALEVHSIERVRVSSSVDPTPREVPAFHRLRVEGETDGPQASSEMAWLAVRGPMPSGAGTEMRLQLRDPHFDPMRPADKVLSVDTWCCNRDLPSLLPFTAGQQSLRIADPAAPAAGAACLSVATPTLRPELRERSGWRLVSHLALNHLGVTGGPQGVLALREILRLHDLKDTPETRMALEGLVAVDAKPAVARVPGMRPGSFARGLDVSFTFEPQAWAAGGLFVLGSVLERFLSLQVSINAFVRTSAFLRGRSGAVASWPARSGSRTLL